jgi:transposase-like protein
MAKMRIGYIEVEATSAKQALMLFDKAIQYAKILQTEAEAMISCPICASYAIEPVSPTLNRCQVCNVEFEFIPYSSER